MNTSYKKLETHCKAWLRKAGHYKHRRRFSVRIPFGSNLNRPSIIDRNRETQTLFDTFDRFISLFVVFNMLYTEVGKVLISQGRVKPPKKPYAPLPDKESATTHIVNYMGYDFLRREITTNDAWRQSVDNFLGAARNGFLAFHENHFTGEINIDKDRELMKSAGDYEPKAILELIYQVRCNLFHGRKEIIGEQHLLLNNMSDFLECLNGKLLERLKQDVQS